MAATVKTNAVKMSYTKDGVTFDRTLSGMNTDRISDTTTAASFATDYSGIVDGSLTSALFIESTPVPIG